MAVSIVVIITWGKVLHSIYESDRTPPPRPASSESKGQNPKGPSEWVMKEYALRKNETKETTKKRFGTQEKELGDRYKAKKKDLESRKKGEGGKYILKKSDERRKDLVDLKKMLEARKLDPIGLEKDPWWMMSPKKEKEEVQKKIKDGKAKKGEEEAQVKGGGKLTMADKIRKALLGNVMAVSIKKEKNKTLSPTQGTSMPEVEAVQSVAARGPGWEVAPPATGVDLAKSAGVAEALARGMGK